MGNPKHYSIELPGRCLKLIDELWSTASEIRAPHRPDLGPLTSTFLLSMSMPILNIPVERIERHIGKPEGAAYADDRSFSPEAVEAFDAVIRHGRLGDAPFYADGAWRFVDIREEPFPNIADGLPDDVTDRLSEDQARAEAWKMDARQWISVLRNAMAHGGIAYLDADGRSNYDRPVKMYAFVSGKYGKPKCKHADAECHYGMGALEKLYVLRISEDDYLRFLRQWVAWLTEKGIIRRSAA